MLLQQVIFLCCISIFSDVASHIAVALLCCCSRSCSDVAVDLFLCFTSHCALFNAANNFSDGVRWGRARLEANGKHVLFNQFRSPPCALGVDEFFARGAKEGQFRSLFCSVQASGRDLVREDEARYEGPGVLPGASAAHGLSPLPTMES